MARRVQHIEGDAADLQLIAVGERAVWREGRIDEGIAEAGGAGAALGAGRAEAHDLAAEPLLQRPRTVAMVAMAVGDQDMADALAPRRFGDGRKMSLVGRAWVDDGHAAAADEIGVGAEEGVGRGVIGDNAAHLRGDLFGHTVVDIDASIEGKFCRHGPLV